MVDEAKFKQNIFDLLKSKDLQHWHVEDDRRNYGGDRQTLSYRGSIFFMVEPNEFCLYVKEVVSGDTHIIVEPMNRDNLGYFYAVFVPDEIPILKELVRKKVQVVSRHLDRQNKHDAMKIAQTIMDLDE